MTSFSVMEGPDIDEESVQVQDQDNEVEIIDGTCSFVESFINLSVSN